MRIYISDNETRGLLDKKFSEGESHKKDKNKSLRMAHTEANATMNESITIEGEESRKIW